MSRSRGKADETIVYAFHHAAEVWWRGIENKLTRPQNLAVYRVPTAASQDINPTSFAPARDISDSECPFSAQFSDCPQITLDP